MNLFSLARRDYGKGEERKRTIKIIIVFMKDSQQFHIAWHNNRAYTSLLPVVDPEQWKSTQLHFQFAHACCEMM